MICGPTMCADQPNDDRSDDQLVRGLELFCGGDFWEAHEHWENLWLSLPEESAARRATKALIQLAAICYKPEQAAQGREPAQMRRGMERLLQTARDHLETSRGLSDPGPNWNRATVESALDRLDSVLENWRNEGTLSVVRDQIAELAARFDPR